MLYVVCKHCGRRILATEAEWVGASAYCRDCSMAAALDESMDDD